MKWKLLKLIFYLILLACVTLQAAPAMAESSVTTINGTINLTIAVTPASPANLAVGSTQQFTATGTYSDGSNANISSLVTWASSNTTVATISSAGLATGVAVGNTNITAAMSGVTSPAVSLPVLTQ